MLPWSEATSVIVTLSLLSSWRSSCYCCLDAPLLINRSLKVQAPLATLFDNRFVPFIDLLAPLVTPKRPVALLLFSRSWLCLAPY